MRNRTVSIARSFLPAALLFVALSARASEHKLVAEIKCELWCNHLYFDAQVNGKGPFKFLFDTGAGGTVIDKERAEELGLKSSGSTQAVGAGAARVTASIFPGATITTGGLTTPPRTLVGIPLDRISRMSGRAVDAVLGYDVFGKYVVEIDYETKTVRLYEPEGYEYTGQGETLPFELRINHIRIKAKVTGQGGKTADGGFIVDTGATGSLGLSGGFVSANDLLTEGQKAKPPVPVGAGVGGAVNGRLSRVASVALGGFRVEKPLTTFETDSKGVFADDSLAGIIGYGILKRFKVIVNYPARTITLEKNARYAEPEIEGTSGVQVEAEAPSFRKYKIQNVWPGAAADKAGLKAGDELVGVGGKPVSEIPMSELREIFRKAGKRIPVTVKRGEQTVKVDVLVEKIE